MSAIVALTSNRYGIKLSLRRICDEKYPMSFVLLCHPASAREGRSCTSHEHQPFPKYQDALVSFTLSTHLRVPDR